MRSISFRSLWWLVRVEALYMIHQRALESWSVRNLHQRGVHLTHCIGRGGMSWLALSRIYRGKIL